MSRLSAWSLGVLLACACESGSSPTARAPQPAAAELKPLANPAPPLAAAPATPDPKSESARGLAFRITNAAATPIDLGAIGQLIVAAQTDVTLDLGDGTRVIAAPRSQLCALAFAPSLLLVSGQVHVTRLPDAARAGLVSARIATWAGALETTPSTDATLRVEAKLDARGRGPLGLREQLQLERGGLTWLALDERSQLQETQLMAGAAEPVPIAALHWLAVGQAAPAFRKLPWTKLAAAADSDRALELALTQQQALRDRGHELLASVSPHHAALAKLAREDSTQANAKPEAGSTREYQRALVEHAQRSHAHAAQLLLAAERSLLQALLLCDGEASAACVSAQAWSARFATRVAGLL